MNIRPMTAILTSMDSVVILRTVKGLLPAVEIEFNLITVFDDIVFRSYYCIFTVYLNTPEIRFSIFCFHSIDGIDERSEEHTSELQSRGHLVCRLLLEKKN